MDKHATEEASPEIRKRLEGLCDRFQFGAVLEALADRASGGALPKPSAALLKGRALAGFEQYHTAYGLFSEVRNEKELPAVDRVEAQVRSARVLRHASPLVDFALQLSLAAAENGERGGERGLGHAVEARVEAAQLFARKRCPALAETQLEKARALGVDLARVHMGEGELALSFDDRPKAMRAFEAALACGEPLGARLGHLGLARVQTLLGEFDGAHEHLRALLPIAPLDTAAHRVSYRLFSAQGNWDSVATSLAHLCSVIPEGDYTRYLMNDRAAALYRAGRIAEARAAWEEVAAGKDYAAETARRMLQKTARADAPARRLAAFPSVSQLRDHCGPASVELCLRFFGLAANQVDVAREIKHPDGGTPVHRMRWYMDRAGFQTRRIEADLPKLKAILDSQIPVILEEDYSTSRHVAVAIGYDDRRELLEVQDPMTHEIRETFYEELPKLREYSNHGALVAIPSDRPDLVAKLDAIGAVECEYITKTDLAWKAFDDDKPEDGDALAREAIALHEPYELAWVYRFTHARNRYLDDRTEANKAKVVEILNGLLALWPDDEWPQQFLGRFHDLNEEYEPALAAFERARDRDPSDANNYCSIGDCLLSLDRRADARKAFEQALERDPSHVRSTENLSNGALEEGDLALAEILNDCARERAPKNPFNHHVRGRLLAERADYRGAAAAYDKAIELAPNSAHYVVQRSRNLAKAGSVDEALVQLRAFADAQPKNAYVLVQWGDIAYESRRPKDALEATGRLQKLDDSHAASYGIGGAAMCLDGRLDEGLSTMRKALTLSPTYSWVYREMGRHLSEAGRHLDAIAASAAHAGFSPNPWASFLLGRALAGGGYDKPALDHLKRGMLSGNLTETEQVEAARIMRRAIGIGPAHDYFVWLEGQRERDAAVFLAHVRLLVEETWFPGAAGNALAKLSELRPEHPLVLAKNGDDLMDASLEAEPKGEALLRAALERAPELVYPRRLLARQLNQRGRFDEARTILEPMPADRQTTEDRVEAMLGLGREDEARRIVEAYAQTLPEAERPRAAHGLLYRLAFAAARYDEALKLAEATSEESGELADDGELSPWERKRFECLVLLGRTDEAYTFGRAQCADAEDLGDLAYEAVRHDAHALAMRFAEEALAKDPQESSALFVLGKQAEMRGDIDGAIAHWERMKEITGWHIHAENIGRVSLGRGDLERASTEIATAVATGHCCHVALQGRAELRLLQGDREGARADAERALSCTPLEWRHLSEDTLGLLAGLAGKNAEARALYERLLGRQRLSKNGQARLSKVTEALGL